jgi:hypothetical protein
MPSSHNVFSSMGDTCEWNATTNAFLSIHNPCWPVDFYQIFDQIPEGVNAIRNRDPDEVPVGLPVGIVLRQRKWAV